MQGQPFNWSLLDRSNLYEMLNGIQSKVVGRSLLIEDLHKILATHIKRNLPIKVKLDRDSKNDKGYIYVGGAYYSGIDKEQDYRHIEIIFSYNPEQRRLKLSRHRWVRTCLLFADTVLHEVIHCRQYRSRNFKTIPGYQSTAYYARDRKEQNYYGDTDEIGAFAFNIACELIDRFGHDFDAASKYMDSNEYKRHKRTCFFKYMNAFDNNHNHWVIKKLKKKVISYLPNALEIGKPFRTASYLTY